MVDLDDKEPVSIDVTAKRPRLDVVEERVCSCKYDNIHNHQPAVTVQTLRDRVPIGYVGCFVLCSRLLSGHGRWKAVLC